ncbi:MAG: hypothetical protein FD143_2078 [Ignavibacteria bacterium]|nr:MAG: hypothetical protein FD143_2078 [Ignavibacteria bacterium]KAF0160422.1 MAG: hypothetical protein FD188_1800 [Ignavibacteria bacterium]
MKKILIALALIIFISTGCLDYTQVTTIKTDGTGTIFIHYFMKWSNQRDSSLVEQLGIFNKDSVYKEFSSEFSQITNVEVYKDLQDSTIHGKVELAFNSLDSLNNTPAFRKSQLSFKDGDQNSKIFSQFIPPIATGFGLENKSFGLTFVYYLPGEILNHNATETYRNKLTWQYSVDELGMGKYITASYRPFKLKETPIWIYIIALIVLFVVIVYLFSKRIK